MNIQGIGLPAGDQVLAHEVGGKGGGHRDDYARIQQQLLGLKQKLAP